MIDLHVSDRPPAPSLRSRSALPISITLITPKVHGFSGGGGVAVTRRYLNRGRRCTFEHLPMLLPHTGVQIRPTRSWHPIGDSGPTLQHKVPYAPDIRQTSKHRIIVSRGHSRHHKHAPASAERWIDWCLLFPCATPTLSRYVPAPELRWSVSFR